MECVDFAEIPPRVRSATTSQHPHVNQTIRSITPGLTRLPITLFCYISLQCGRLCVYVYVCGRTSVRVGVCVCMCAWLPIWEWLEWPVCLELSLCGWQPIIYLWRTAANTWRGVGLHCLYILLWEVIIIRPTEHWWQFSRLYSRKFINVSLYICRPICWDTSIKLCLNIWYSDGRGCRCSCIWTACKLGPIANKEYTCRSSIKTSNIYIDLGLPMSV